MSHAEDTEASEETTILVQERNLDLFSVISVSSSERRERA